MYFRIVFVDVGSLSPFAVAFSCTFQFSDVAFSCLVSTGEDFFLHSLIKGSNMVLRVVECGCFLAAPLLGRHLAGLGCDVVTILRPKTSRGAREEAERMTEMWPELRRGKKCVELDLPTQVNEALELLKTADVLISNFASGVLDRLGLSVENCQSANPRIVIVHMPGFAHDAKEKATESIIMASSGVFVDMGLNRTLLGVQASYSSLPLASVYASIFGAFAVASAIFNERYGEVVEVPLASALTEALTHNSVEFPLDENYMNARQRRIKSGAYPVDASVLDSLMDPFFRKYWCADGRSIYLVCPAHARHQREALRVLGLDPLLLPTVDPYSDEYWQCGIGSANLDADQAARLQPIIASVFATLSASVWESRLGMAGVPAIAHRTTEEWIASDHARESGLVGPARELAPIGWFSESRTVTADFRTQTMREVFVVDLTNVIAGPTIGAMMARFGANVVKVDPPQPTYAPEIAVLYGLSVNTNKRSMLLDICNPQGRCVLVELIRRADMVIMNCTNAAAVRTHLTVDEVRAINPDTILVRFDAWGGPLERGPFIDYNGYDDNVQAAIGVMARFGGSLEEAEEHAHIGTIDVIAGVGAAAASVIALLRRKRASEVVAVRSSLAAIGQYLQLPFMCGVTRSTSGTGLACRGEHALHRCYETRDGWIMLVAKLVYDANTETRLIAALGGCSSLEQTLLAYTTAEALRMFACMQCNAVPLRRICDARQLVRTATRQGGSFQYVVYDDHPIGRLIQVGPIAIRMKHLSGRHRPAPKYGQHTLEILEEIRMPQMSLTSCVKAGWSRAYLPFAAACLLCHARSRRILLACGHAMCFACLSTLRESRRECPICGMPHEVDPLRLRLVAVVWKEAYGNWRRGRQHGSSSIERAFVPPTALRRAYSSPVLESKSCDDAQIVRVGSQIFAEHNAYKDLTKRD